MSLGCGHHRAFIVKRGGVDVIGEVTPLLQTRWERRRDDISQASVIIGADGDCCEWLGEVRTVKHELHLYRDEVKVWEGVITRLEYRSDVVEVYAQDILWVAKNTALEEGYSNAFPNVGTCGHRMGWLLNEQTYAKYGDPWNMTNRLHRIVGSEEPKTSKVVRAFTGTTFDDFDKFAEDSGMDYTVIGRDVYWWETHLKVWTLPPLLPEYLEAEPAIVEYGNEFATRVFVTNGNGATSMAQHPPEVLAEWGYVDTVNSTWNEADGNETPTDEELAAWYEQAKAYLGQTPEPPAQVRVTQNTGLSQDAPYDINDLRPGSWLIASVTSLCRQLESWHKLDSVNVSEENGKEVVAITTITAPAKGVDLP
jgi:hypothetical protein